MKEGMKIVSLEAENFKNIEKKIVEINGRSLLITGKNSAGKSSLIQALLSGIDSKIQPTDSIRKGQTKGSTKVVIAGVMNGVEEKYCLEMFYTPANQAGRIVLTNSQGEKVKSPKEVLKSIIGNISFDIFTFLKSKKADQIKILKELSGVAPEINKLDFERKAIFDDRTFLKRTVEETEAIMNNHGLSPDEIDTYSETKDLAPLQEVMANISKKITTWNEVSSKVKNFKTDAEVTIPDAIKKRNEEILFSEKEIEKLKEKIAEYEQTISIKKDRIKELEIAIESSNENVKKGEAWLEKNPEPKAEEASKAISDAVLHNEKCSKVTELAKKQKALIADKQKLEKLNQDIEVIDNKKDHLIKNSKLPIKGLTFNDDNIFLDGLPLEEGQINTAELINIGVEIAMALNPNLRVIFIHEGSLFDKEGLAALIKKVEDKGYQLIVELVSESDELEIKFTEKTVEG